MKVLIGVPCTDNGRFTVFWDSLLKLDKGYDDEIYISRGSSVSANRNAIIDHAQKHDFEYILFLDDDMVFRDNILTKLLENDEDVVSGLYLSRHPIFAPLIFDEYREEKAHTKVLDDKEFKKIPIAAAGAGCLLIKTEVFKKLEKPYFDLGQIEKDKWCDDINFFKKLQNAEVKCFCDLRVALGHINHSIVWPIYDGKKWTTVLNIENLNLNVPRVIEKTGLTFEEQK